MLIKYSIKAIPGQGSGMVVEDFVPKGTRVWEFHSKNVQFFADRKSIEDELAKCPTQEKKQEFLDFLYAMDGHVVLMLDDSKYFNHDEKPNVDMDESITYCVTNRDIEPQEQLTIDYNKLPILEWLDAGWRRFRGQRFCYCA